MLAKKISFHKNTCSLQVKFIILDVSCHRDTCSQQVKFTILDFILIYYAFTFDLKSSEDDILVTIKDGQKIRWF